MTAIPYTDLAAPRAALPTVAVRFRLPFATSAIAGLSARLRADGGILPGDAEVEKALHSPLVDVVMLTRGSRL